MALFNPDDNVLIYYEDALQKITVISGEIDRHAHDDANGSMYWVRTNLGIKLLVPESKLQGV